MGSLFGELAASGEAGFTTERRAVVALQGNTDGGDGGGVFVDDADNECRGLRDDDVRR